MKCKICNSETFWCNDFDTEDYGYDFEGIVSIWCCGNCDRLYQHVNNFDDNREYIILEEYS